MSDLTGVAGPELGDGHRQSPQPDNSGHGDVSFPDSIEFELSKRYFASDIADTVQDADGSAPTKDEDKTDVKSEKDNYNDDHDGMTRNCKIATDRGAFGGRLPGGQVRRHPDRI